MFRFDGGGEARLKVGDGKAFEAERVVMLAKQLLDAAQWEYK